VAAGFSLASARPWAGHTGSSACQHKRLSGLSPSAVLRGSAYVALAVLYWCVALCVTWLAFRGRSCRLRATRAILIVTVVAWPTGQVLNQPRLTYPFIPWTLYSSRLPINTFVMLVGYTERGGRHELTLDDFVLWSPGPLVGYSAQSPFLRKIVELRRECGCLHSDRVLDAVLQSIARAAAQRVGSDLVRIEIHEVVFSLRSSTREGAVVYVWSA
jgi:hypothetical protein